MMDAMQKALEVPHMTFCDEVNVDPLKVLRSSLTEAAECRGVRLSYMPLIVKVGVRSPSFSIFNFIMFSFTYCNSI